MKGRYCRLLLLTTILIFFGLSLAGCKACKTTIVTTNTNNNNTVVGPTPIASPTDKPIVGTTDEVKDEGEEKDKAKDKQLQRPIGGGSLIGNVQRYYANVLVNGSRLKNNNPLALYPGWRVATDDDGQAKLNLGGCGSVFMFHKGSFVMASCPKSEYGKSTTCASGGTFAFNNSCTSKFRRAQTPSSEIELLGTYFGVIYRPQEKLSLVTVSNGIVRIRPVINMKKRILGEESEPIMPGFFYYTMPGTDPAAIAGVPQRKPLPFSELPKLIIALGEMAAIEDIRERGKLDLLSPDVLPPTGRSVVVPPTGFNFESPGVGIPQSREIFIEVQNKIPVTFKTLTIAGPNQSDFERTADGCSGKTIDIRCSLTITFIPRATTQRNATLNILSNADNSPQTSPLVGIVRANAVIDPSTPTLNFSATERLSFNLQKVSTASATQTVTVTNEGTAQVLVTGVDFKDASQNFEIRTNNCLNTNLAPKGTCTIEILYTPQTEGQHKANLLVYAKSSSPVDIAVSQSVASKSVELSGRGGVPLANFAAEALCFDRWKKVKSGESKIRERLSVYVTNSGTVPLTIGSAEIQGTNKQDFSVTENTCRDVDINGNCRITVGFIPKKEKIRKGTLVITHDGSQAPAEIPLSGVGKPRNWFLRLVDRVIGKRKPC